MKKFLVLLLFSLNALGMNQKKEWREKSYKRPMYMARTEYLSRQLSDEEKKKTRNGKIFLDAAISFADKIGEENMDVWIVDSNKSKKINTWLVGARDDFFTIKITTLPEARLLYVTEVAAKKHGYKTIQVAIDRKPATGMDSMPNIPGITNNVEEVGGETKRFMNQAQDLLLARGYRELFWEGDLLVMAKDLS